jgi:hypothetical protein
MKRTYPHIQFERYADDAICHCKNSISGVAQLSGVDDARRAAS